MEMLDQQLRKLHTSVESLVQHRKGVLDSGRGVLDRRRCAFGKSKQTTISSRQVTKYLKLA